MTNEMNLLIAQSTYLVDYEARKFIILDHKKSPEKIYEQLCKDYQELLPCGPDKNDFINWVNDNYTAFEMVESDKDLYDLEWEYKQGFDSEIEDFFRNPQYFAWL